MGPAAWPRDEKEEALIRTLPSIVLGLALCLSASAQDVLEGDFDGHGLTPPATDGRTTDPLTLSRPGLTSLGSFSVGVLFEYANEPLVRYTADGGVVTPTVLLKDVPALNLSGHVGLHRRVGLGISLPFFPMTSAQVPSTGDGEASFESYGPALGDVQLRVPIGIILPDNAGNGLALSVAPYAELPTGANARFLADRGVSAGAIGLLGVDLGPVGLTANLGGGFRGTESQENVSSGLEVLGGVGGSYGLGDSLAVHAEVRGAVIPGSGSGPTDADVPSALRAPVEGLLGVRGRTSSGLWWSAGAGSGLTGGAGAARIRAFAGVGYSRVPEDDPGSLPAEPTPTLLVVTDPEGQPIADAAVYVGDEEIGRTDANGQIELPANTRWSKGVRVDTEFHQGIELTQPTESSLTVALAHDPVGLPISVRNQDGAPVSGTVTAIGPAELAPVPIGADGVALLDLPPGEWELVVDAPNYGGQVRKVVVEPREVSEPVEVLLLEDLGDAELELVITDRDGAPLEGVAVRIDGAPVGETGDGGVLAVRGIAAGTHDVEVISDAYQSLEKSGLELGTGKTSVDFNLRRVPGSVLVVATGADGPATDVSVRFDGPSRLPSAQLGADGSRIFPGMRAGTWEVWAISSTYGIQRRELVVEPEDTRLLTVEFQMQQPEGGAADLRVAVVDPDGNPLEDVEITIDGNSYGSTASGGAVEIAGLKPGPRSLAVAGERYEPREPMPLFLVEGQQEKTVVLGWRPGIVQVRAIGPDEPVEDGKVRFMGPAEAPGGALDADGMGWFELVNGDWAMLVTSTAYGLQQRALTVDTASRRLTRAEVVFSAPEGGEADLVVTALDPSGQPVPSAAITLDGLPLGSTSSGGSASLTGLSAGSRKLEVTAPLFKPSTASVRLAKGDNAHTAKLGYSPGAVHVEVRAGGKPVTDATVRFAGAEMQNPLSVDESGDAWTELPAGEWYALVASPTYGLQQKALVLDGKKPGPHKLAFDLEPLGEAAELVVRVVDPDGAPIPGATVRAGERSVDTPEGGVALLTGLAPGKVALEISAPNFATATLPAAELVAGAQERIVPLSWVPAKVSAKVTDGAGKPLAATLSFDGPAEVADVAVDGSGAATFDLRPGTWKVLASAADFGTKATTLEITPGTEAAEIAVQLGEAQVKTTDTEVQLLGKVQFDLGKATLRSESEAILSEVAATLIANRSVVRVEVQGHTDPTGGNVINLALSQARAEAVVADLVRRGVAPERLVARGYGSTRPVQPNDSEEGRALNRRVQFEIVEQSE
ncbi:MAG: hypothetical protein EP330_07375 [Deltaproteobacteria bacterium]|nr:MAG: hypothetical protein EP330_07375 [Deltaproteobacteria bacterium]